MKVALDTSPLENGHSHRGIGSYTRLLLAALREHIAIVEPADADIIHYPFFDLFFLTLPLIKTKPTVVTIHDVIPLVLQDHYPSGIRGHVKLAIQTHSLASAAHIVTDSDCSTRDVISYLHQPPKKVSTVYLAPDPAYAPASKEELIQIKDKYSLSKPYFLFVGDINYNKNIPGLLQSFSKLNGVELVIVSKALTRENHAADFIWKVYDSLHLQDRVKVLSSVATDELRVLYSGALWYVQPSFYEGFGLPVLEAQACGCPVISTVGGSLAEIVASSGLIDQPSALEHLLQKALDADRNEYISKGFENSIRFSWQKTADEMIKVYKTCLR